MRSARRQSIQCRRRRRGVLDLLERAAAADEALERAMTAVIDGKISLTSW